jgi:putative transposase
MVGRQADAVVLSAEERDFLEAQVRRHKTPRSLSDRCRIILLCADGSQSKEVAERLGVHEHTVGKWRRRFVKDRIEGLTDEYRPGRPRTVSDDQVAEGTVRNFVCGRAVEHYAAMALMKRSPNRTAN